MSINNLQPAPLDESTVEDMSLSFSGGMVSNNRANKLEANQFAFGQNVDIDQLGQVTTRRGSVSLGTSPTSSPVQGLSYFDTPATEMLLQVANTNLYSFGGTSWDMVSGYTASSDALRVEFAQLSSYMYFVDGSGVAYRTNGTTTQASGSWGVGTAPVSGLKYIRSYRNRLAFAGNPVIPEALDFSDIGDANTPNSNRIIIGSGDGDPIKGIFPWITDTMLVFKERSIFGVDTSLGVGTNASTKLIHGFVGCVSNRSIAQIGSDDIGDDVFFLAKDGVRSVLTTVQDGKSGVNTKPLSYEINNYIQRINWNQAERCEAIYWNNRYLLAVPMDSAEYPNFVLVYHTFNKSWSGIWMGWTPTKWTISAFDGDLRLNFGQQDGKVRQWLDYVSNISESASDFMDDDNEIETDFISKAYVYQSFINNKLGFSSICEYFESNALVDISVILDSGNITNALTQFDTDTSSGFSIPFDVPFTIGKTGVRRAIFDLMQYGEFSELQIRSFSSAGKQALKSVMSSSFMRTQPTYTIS